MFAVNRQPDRLELHRFGHAMLGGFAVLAAAVWLLHWRKVGTLSPLDWDGSRAQVAALVLATLGVALLALSRGPYPLARAVYVAWMSAAMLIGRVMTPLLLTVLFLLVLPWFSLIRLGDPLRKKLRRTGSYWEDCKPYPSTLERMQRPF